MIAPSDGRHEKMQEAALRRAEARGCRQSASAEPSFAARLGQIGVLGWAIVAPILIGVVIGRWLDRTFADRHLLHRAAHHARRRGGLMDGVAMDASAMIVALMLGLRRRRGPRRGASRRRCGGAWFSCATGGRSSGSWRRRCASSLWRWRWPSSRVMARRRSSPRRSASWPRAPFYCDASRGSREVAADARAAVPDRPGADHRAGRRRLGGHRAARRLRGAVDAPPRAHSVQDPGDGRNPRLRPSTTRSATRCSAIRRRFALSSARSSCSR